MKRFLAVILTILMVMSHVTFISANEETVTVTLDGTKVSFPDAKPFIDARNRTLVPLRFVSEAMGAEVSWEAATRTVVIDKDSENIRYTIGQPLAYLNGEMLTFDSYGIIKEDRTFVPLRFIAEMLSCDVDWDESSKNVVIKSSSANEKFPKPEITVHYPESENDTRMFWITLDNYRDFKKNCPYYEFKIEFKNPVELNTYEQDEGAINGWQKYSVTNFSPLTLSFNTILSVNRAYYTTRENKKVYVPKDGDVLNFELTVLRKCSNETRKYEYSEVLKLPYPLIDVEE